jgi:hypothetical protein
MNGKIDSGHHQSALEYFHWECGELHFWFDIGSGLGLDTTKIDCVHQIYTGVPVLLRFHHHCQGL